MMVGRRMWNLGNPCHPNPGSQWPERGLVDTQPSLWALEETTHKNTLCQGWFLSSPTLFPFPGGTRVWCWMLG